MLEVEGVGDCAAACGWSVRWAPQLGTAAWHADLQARLFAAESRWDVVAVKRLTAAPGPGTGRGKVVKRSKNVVKKT